MSSVTKPIALDESLNTTESPSRNIADVLAEELGNLAVAISKIAPQTTYDELSKLEDVTLSTPTSGQILQYNGSKWVNANGGGSGHTIENSSGVDMTARANLQFKDLDVTDDSGNDRTVVDAGAKANKTDLASLNLTGSTNTSGSTIKNGTYFYLNGSLVRAIADISSGSTFTLNTNYKVVNGALNEIKSTTLKATIGAVVAGKAYFKYDFNYTEILSLSVLIPNNAQNFQWFLAQDAPTGYDLTLRFSSSEAIGTAKLLVMYR